MIRPVLLTAALLATSACFTGGSEPPAFASDGNCRNEPLEPFVGRQASVEAGSAMMQASGAKLIQWISPDEMVTQEFRQDRLRIQLDSAGRVQSARCG